jgi:hypothetical protein
MPAIDSISPTRCERAEETERTLADCLSEEIEAGQFVSALASGELRTNVANSFGEISTALDALQQYAN